MLHTCRQKRIFPIYKYSIFSILQEHRHFPINHYISGKFSRYGNFQT